MMLVQMTVKDKLKGKVYVESGENGTSVTFDFLIDKSTEDWNIINEEIEYFTAQQGTVQQR